MRVNTDALVYMPSIRGWELERMTFLCCCGLLVNHRSPQIKGQDQLLFDLPMNLQLWDSERSVGVFRKKQKLLCITLCTCKLSTAYNVGFCFSFLSFWRICKCVPFTQKPQPEISHFICQGMDIKFCLSAVGLSTDKHTEEKKCKPGNS